MPDEKAALANISDMPGLEGLTQSGPNPETEFALDNLFSSETGGQVPPKNPEEEFEASEVTRKKNEMEAKAKAEAEAEDAEAEAKAKLPAEDEAKAKVEAKVEAEEAAAAKVKMDAEALEAAKDDFDKVELPAYTKPKTVAAFDIVKKLAREKVLALAKELETSQTKSKELEEKGNGKLDPAIEKELKELRAFRSSVDVEADPVFSTYDEKIKGNIDSIYAKLAELKTAPEAIEKIKEFGGPEHVDWDSVKMASPLRRFIESKLANNIELADQKKTALDAAKKNATEYLKTRRAEFEKTTGDESKVVEGEISALAKDFPWMSVKQVKAGAAEAEAKEIEAHNKIAIDIREMMKEAVSDSSPRMRALLAIGTAQFVNLRAEYARQKQSHELEMSKLKKELDESKVLIEKVQKSSTNRLRDSPAISGKKEPGQMKSEFNEPAMDALDRHLKELQGATA